MPFLETCQASVGTLALNRLDRAILEYLLSNAVGKDNLKSWASIESALRANGLTDIPENAKELFQTGLLKRTRECDAFIGSTGDGYFIINDLPDAFACLNFYLKRIATEQKRVETLRQLIERTFLNN